MWGGLACCLPVEPVPLIPASQPASQLHCCKLVMRQGGQEVGAPPRGSCVVFITGASSECAVSKRLFLFSPGSAFIARLQRPCSRHGAEQGLPRARASQVWDAALKKAAEVVSEGFVGPVSCLASILVRALGKGQHSPLTSSVGRVERLGLAHGIKPTVCTFFGLMLGMMIFSLKESCFWESLFLTKQCLLVLSCV